MHNSLNDITIRDSFLSKYATLNRDVIRLNEEKKDIRLPFFRDVDRIIYTLSYVRYIDKTQVFSFTNNDHICKRMIHVQFVSKIARTIGRALDLNEDLIEAAALGHDLGHVPFGHVGEHILSEISLKHNEGYFNHNIQSVRTLLELENKGKGVNVSLQVLDAIMCHNGELLCDHYQPQKKTKEDFFSEYKRSYDEKGFVKKLRPMTLEGCVVRISDVIGYIGRDLEDAIRLGIIKTSDIPNNILTTLGSTNSEIVNTIVTDVIKNSKDKPYIKMSDNVYQAMIELKEFNTKNIYLKANTDEELIGYKKMFETLFDSYLKALNNNDDKSSIYSVFLDNMNKTYIKNNTKERIVIDYIAGMTDEYFIREYNKVISSN